MIRNYSRTAVQAVACPRCKAKPGWNCWGGRKATYPRRTSNHMERVDRYKELLREDAGNVRSGHVDAIHGAQP